MNHNLLQINSKDKSNDQMNNNDFKVNYGNNEEIHNVNRIVLKSVDIPNVFYNVNEYNNIFKHPMGAETVIPVGQYSLDDLILVLKTLDSRILDIVLNSVTKKLDFTFTTSTHFLGEKDGNLIAPLLGITKTDVDNFGSPITPQGFPNLAGISEVYIHSMACCDGNNLITANGINHGVLAVVPITVPFGAVEHHQSSHPELDHYDKASLKSGSSLREIDIQVKDSSGNLLDLGGLNINIVLKVFHL